jgi:hypothetical protein
MTRIVELAKDGVMTRIIATVIFITDPLHRTSKVIPGPVQSGQ